MKTLIYEDGFVNSTEDFVARISIAAVTIREMSDFFTSIWWSIDRRFEACVFIEDRNFEQLM